MSPSAAYRLLTSQFSTCKWCLFFMSANALKPDLRISRERRCLVVVFVTGGSFWQFDLRSQYRLMWNDFEGLRVMQFRRQLLDVCAFQHTAAGGTSTS